MLAELAQLAISVITSKLIDVGLDRFLAHLGITIKKPAAESEKKPIVAGHTGHMVIDTGTFRSLHYPDQIVSLKRGQTFPPARGPGETLVPSDWEKIR